MNELAMKRARAGAKWLDEHHPGWVDKIDLKKLDLSGIDDPATPYYGEGTTKSCVLCQVAGASWTIARRRLNVPHRQLIGHGFEAGDQVEYHDLDDAWKTIILERRGA